jgi:toxin ParE1/3/4
VSERPVRFLAATRVELRRAADRYDTQVPGLGDEFAAEVESVIAQVISHPEIGAPFLAGTRRVLVRRFPFGLVYRIWEEQLVVIAVAHQQRRPGYWLRRL